MILQETSPKHSKRLPLLVPIYSFAWLVPVLLSCFLMSLPFDLAEATRHLSSCDEKLAALIAETAQFQTEVDAAQSPYEALLESIASTLSAASALGPSRCSSSSTSAAPTFSPSTTSACKKAGP